MVEFPYSRRTFHLTRTVIEIFGRYWHRDEDPQKLIKKYAGVQVICYVYWEDELDEAAALVTEMVRR